MIIRKAARLVESVRVDLGDAEVDLRYDFNARAALIQSLTPAEVKIFDKWNRPGSKMTPPMVVIIKLVWAGTQHEEDAPGIKEVGAWIHESRLPEILEKVSEALAAQGLGGGKSDTAENPTEAQPTGATNLDEAGQSDVTIAA